MQNKCQDGVHTTKHYKDTNSWGLLGDNIYLTIEVFFYKSKYIFSIEYEILQTKYML